MSSFISYIIIYTLSNFIKCTLFYNLYFQRCLVLILFLNGFSVLSQSFYDKFSIWVFILCCFITELTGVIYQICFFSPSEMAHKCCIPWVSACLENICHSVLFCLVLLHLKDSVGMCKILAQFFIFPQNFVASTSLYFGI